MKRRGVLLGLIASAFALSVLSGSSRIAHAAGKADVTPPRPPRWKVSPAPPQLEVRARTFYLELAPSQGSLIEVVEDAGDANRDGFRDVLVFLDRPDRVGKHRRQFILVLGGRKLLSPRHSTMRCVFITPGYSRARIPFFPSMVSEPRPMSVTWTATAVPMSERWTSTVPRLTTTVGAIALPACSSFWPPA
jgi:hypothetical protein